ncbi:class I SAM-dependent methyltransferase [Streptomyces silaceus]|uniref:class I SAM-dependent methyltransferase n=1 Tax=Streptomyces silaceus TaxID=545123 RepID=UPI0006EB368D|nr:class I SAM-dependent methyltransferase [Streptomyces silaceus]
MTVQVPESASSPEETDGQPYYEERRLKLYDAVVVKASNRLLWRCPKARLVGHYNSWVSSSHLEVGPGSGYYLDHCRFPTAAPDITLLDLNPDPLRFVAHRLRRFAPRTVRADVLEPLPDLGGPGFDSIAFNYVLHCVPNPPEGKQLVFRHLRQVLAPGGVLFGSTVLSRGVHHTPVSDAFNRLYQRQGSFHNETDSVPMLHDALERYFDWHWIEVRGSVALFAAKAAKGQAIDPGDRAPRTLDS